MGSTRVPRQHRGVGGGRGAEALAECQLTVVVEIVLIAEEDDLVGQQRVVDRRHGRLVEIGGQPCAVDTGAIWAPSLTTSSEVRVLMNPLRQPWTCR